MNNASSPSSVLWDLITSADQPILDVTIAPPRRQQCRQVEAATAFVPCKGDHEWVVHSTALLEGWLMLQCVNCGAMGTVDHPTKEEWSEAFHAWSRPYFWADASRVTERGHAAFRVIRFLDGPRCQCPTKGSVSGPRAYERIPGGIWVHPGGLSDGEEAELLALAKMAVRLGLCSRLIPHYIQHCRTDHGIRIPEVIRTIIDRIEQFDSKGLHCSPPVVAKILKDYATWEPL